MKIHSGSFCVRAQIETQRDVIVIGGLFDGARLHIGGGMTKSLSMERLGIKSKAALELWAWGSVYVREKCADRGKAKLDDRIDYRSIQRRQLSLSEMALVECRGHRIGA
mgnify:CR=1 FL=1